MPQLFTLREYINAELDRRFTGVTRPLFDQVARLATGSGSQVQLALRELEVEAVRLQDIGEVLTPDNAVLVKVLRVIESELVTAQNLIMASASAIEDSGIEIAPTSLMARLFSGVTASLIARAVNPFSASARRFYQEALSGTAIALPTSLDFVRRYVEMPAWIARMEGWGEGYAELISRTLLNGVSQGWSPIRIAREARKLAQGLPISASENITRTLQLHAYRQASAALEVINGKYIEKKIRVAKLDNRTCLTCIALHGTEVPLGQPVEDHYRGRCDAILIPVGGSMPKTMQADSVPGQRNYIPWQQGEAWFAELSPERQAKQSSFVKSPGKLELYREGHALSEFVGTHQDSVFGQQVIELSITKAMGENGV